MENSLSNETLPVLQDILDELRRPRVADDLWSAEEIANFLKLEKNTVQNRVITCATFPRAVRLPTAEKRGTRRWVSKEVRAWALKHKEV